MLRSTTRETLTKAPRRRGFTLLEVLVALAIVGLSLTSIAVTMGGMLDGAVALRERTYASWIAQNRIVEIRAAGSVPEIGVTSGEVEFANSDWAWRAVIAETGVEDLYRIDVEVSRPGADGTVRSVTGFVGEPVIPGQANCVWSGGFAVRDGEPGGADDGEPEATR